MNSEFSFKTGCYPKIKEPSLLYHLPIVRRSVVRCIQTASQPGFELGLLHPFLMRITVTQVPPNFTHSVKCKCLNDKFRKMK